ncbi:MAG: chloride channel protein [Bdellovibrionales bacterium]|nr:chloride channel protein [Bdellovibrionales bacterium]
MTMWIKKIYHRKIGFSLLAALIGIGAGLGAVGFRGLVAFFQNFFFFGEVSFDLVNHLNHDYPWKVIMATPIGILAAYFLVHIFCKEAMGHGVPEVIEAVLAKGGKIRKRVAFVKSLASALTIGSGGSLGREGPIVQIGASLGSTLGQVFNVSRYQLKIAVACGAAAGIAATFNTPIAGVIFAIELILLEWKAGSFIPLVISAVSATLISRMLLGNEPAFIIPNFILVHPLEIFLYLFLGITCAVAAWFFLRYSGWLEEKIENIGIPGWGKAFVGGILIGSVGFVFPEMFGGGYEAVDEILHQNENLYHLVLLFFLKVTMVAVTLGVGGSGGIFAPSLFMGAAIGGSYGLIVHELFPDYTMTYGAYALVGMAAFFSATSRATFTSIVILFEMTRAYPIILPLMFACVIADQVSVLLLKGDTVYGMKLKKKGLHFCTDFGVDAFSITSIQDIMTKKVVSLASGMTIGQAMAFVADHKHEMYPVLNENGVLLGGVHQSDLDHKHAIKEDHDKSVDILMRGTPCAVYPKDSLDMAIKKLERSRDPRIVVIDPSDKKLLGIITPTDLIRFQQKHKENVEDI